MFYRLFLHTFLTVYRLGSQTRAAAELHLTQPAISQHLSSLEKHIGRPLFLRVGKELKPTAAAHQLAMLIGNPIDTLDETWQNFKQKADTAAGTVYLGGIAEFFGAVIAPSLKTIFSQGIQLRFEIGHEILLKKLTTNELDLAQLCAHIVHPGIEVESFFRQQYILVGNPIWLKQLTTKKLTAKNTEDLAKLPWIAYDESLLFIKEYYQTVFEKSFNGKVYLMIKDLWAIIEAVAGGAGITILPTYFCRRYLQQKKLAILYKPKRNPPHYFYLAWKDGALRNPRIATTRNLLKEIVKNYQ